MAKLLTHGRACTRYLNLRLLQGLSIWRLQKSANTDKLVALVTGAGDRGGVGRAIALVLARKGIHVALTDV